MWLGERITDKGIGNGISMIIMIGIIAQLPSAFAFEISARMQGGGFVMLLVEMVFLFLVTIATVALVQGTRRIPVNFAKKVVGNKQFGGARQFIPLKSECCWCYANHICSSFNVFAYDFGRFTEFGCSYRHLRLLSDTLQVFGIML